MVKTSAVAFVIVSGPAPWNTFARDAQHTALSTTASQPLNQIHWQTPMDLQPQYSGTALLIHYGSPLITSANTVIVPVKTGATDGFRVEAREGSDGVLKWSMTTDYILPHNSQLDSGVRPGADVATATLLSRRGWHRLFPGPTRRERGNQRPDRVLRVVELPGESAGVQRRRHHQYSTHHRSCGKRLFRLPGDRQHAPWIDKRDRPNQRQRPGDLDSRDHRFRRLQL